MNEQKPTAPGGDAPPVQEPTATKAAQEVVTKRRGRPKGSGNKAPGENGGGNGGELVAQQQALQEQFAALYAPEMWEGLVALPGNAALAITGDEIWDIPEKEIKCLAVTASATARCFAITDPKWLALAMLFTGVATTYGTRMAEYYMKKAAEKREKENKRQDE